MKSGSTTISVLSLKDLIALKKSTGRPQDISDIHYLQIIIC